MSTTMKFYNAKGYAMEVLIDGKLKYIPKHDSKGRPLKQEFRPTRRQAIAKAASAGFTYTKDGRFDTRRFIRPQPKQ